MSTDSPIPHYLPARLVAARYTMTIRSLDRWADDDRLSFPQPVYLGRMRFWRVADLEAWETAQTKARRGRRGMTLFSLDDLKLDEFLALKKDGHFTLRGNVLTICRAGCPEERIVCASPAEANRLRLELTDGLAGHIEGSA